MYELKLEIKTLPCYVVSADEQKKSCQINKRF